MIIGHPYWEASFSNKAIVTEFRKRYPEAEISNLAELYPDGNIDKDAEQKKLLHADVVVFQFPVMWYSCPSLLHKWEEEVLTYGFCYGPGGDKLKGKKLVCSFTSASSADMYSKYGAQGVEIDKLMPPFATMAKFVGMEWGPYTYSGGMMLPFGADEATKEFLTRRAEDHVNRLGFALA